MVFSRKKEPKGTLPSSNKKLNQEIETQLTIREAQTQAGTTSNLNDVAITQMSKSQNVTPTITAEESLHSSIPNEEYRIPTRKYDDKELFTRTSQYKSAWNKNGIIQYKTDRIAILQRSWGRQVEFIIAYDDLTKEGYRLMAIDEGKEGSSGGIAGGVNAYFYFQKMKYVK